MAGELACMARLRAPCPIVCPCIVDGGVADVRLNRPEKMQRPGRRHVRRASIEAGEALKSDPAVRAVVLSGEGRGFCAGLDFGSFQAMADGPATAERPTGDVDPAATRTAASPTSASRPPGCGRSSPCR